MSTSACHSVAGTPPSDDSASASGTSARPRKLSRAEAATLAGGDTPASHATHPIGTAATKGRQGGGSDGSSGKRAGTDGGLVVAPFTTSRAAGMPAVRADPAAATGAVASLRVLSAAALSYGASVAPAAASTGLGAGASAPPGPGAAVPTLAPVPTPRATKAPPTRRPALHTEVTSKAVAGTSTLVKTQQRPRDGEPGPVSDSGGSGDEHTVPQPTAAASRVKAPGATGGHPSAPTGVKRPLATTAVAAAVPPPSARQAGTAGSGSRPHNAAIGKGSMDQKGASTASAVAMATAPAPKRAKAATHGVVGLAVSPVPTVPRPSTPAAGGSTPAPVKHGGPSSSGFHPASCDR